MHIIQIAPLPNGGHRNQQHAAVCPDGWAVIPRDMALPDSYPFVGVTAVDGVVTALTPGQRPPEPDPAEAEVSA